jgi:iron complex outermembrane receptor protein
LVQSEMPERIVVTAPGGLYDRNEMEAVVADEIRGSGRPDLLQALGRSIPGLSLQEAQSNPFQPNLVYRGFTASPLQGQAQGLAVYLDGVRFNQPFGDTVQSTCSLKPQFGGSTCSMPIRSMA